MRVAIAATVTSAPPHPEATWSHRTIAAQVADTCSTTVSASQVGRIPADLDLRPHKVRGWLTRRDTPDFREHAADVCVLYLDLPQGAVVLSIDEKAATPLARAGIPGAPPPSPVRSSPTGATHRFPSLLPCRCPAAKRSPR
ncbi:hypothetical protein [Streptomyces sp. NPDC059165]|uniref:hypothetical protein n=1 Tax=Streptomyces sp. NPDC059165 TaxID=3346751 RepID=UPI0036B369E9